jgi:hypothetical protein
LDDDDGTGVLPLAKDETREEEKIKEPAPKSIKPYPCVSVLAYLRGKIVKSTAKMATNVMKRTVAR